MKKNGITVHTIVKNEEQWIWYAINSVLDFVDKIIIYDTGSTDKTVAIIKTITNDKIELSLKGEVTSQQLVELRNEQIQKTKTKWFMLLDGDEVWPEKTIKELFSVISRFDDMKSAVVIPAIVPVGDLFHCQPETAGRYNILGKKGHYNIRLYKVGNYRWRGIYPFEAYTDRHGQVIQNQPKKLYLLKNSYWHLTHLKRSVHDDHGRRKLELGIVNNNNIPEVFYKIHPPIVPTPFIKTNGVETMISHLVTPLKKIKREFVNS